MRARAAAIAIGCIAMTIAAGAAGQAAKPGRGVAVIVPFKTAPFPYDGDIPGAGKPFYDVTEAGRRGHTSPRGGVNWEQPTYSDNHVLLYAPKSFDPAKPAAIVVFFHGNLARLDRDVRDRQGAPRQLEQSKLNAILVAPQFAVNVLDSSAGKFWQPGAFAAFMSEAAQEIARITGGAVTQSQASAMPIVLVGYSGGYLPTAFTLALAPQRIAGVVLLDALYGEVDKVGDWLAGHNASAFFLSAYSRSSAAQNASLRQMVSAKGVRATDGLPARLSPGVVSFVPALDAVHNDFVTQAWTADPLKAVLSRVRLKAEASEGPEPKETPQPAATPAPPQEGARDAGWAGGLFKSFAPPPPDPAPEPAPAAEEPRAAKPKPRR